MANTPLAGSLAKASNWSDVFATDVDGWDTYTPTWLQGATNITKTVSRGHYMKIGRTVHLEVGLVATGAGTANNRITVSLPFTGVAGFTPVDSFIFVDAATAIYNGIVVPHSASAVRFFSGQNPGTDLGLTGGGFTAAIAAGDTLSFSMTYEAAS